MAWLMLGLGIGRNVAQEVFRMKKYLFSPRFETIAKVSGTASIKELEAEVGVYSATPEFVRRKCGPIANSILDYIPSSYYDNAKSRNLTPNVDVRIHRLYPGDFPAYPGWHCDGEFRETYFSQPDLERIKVSDHLTCTVSSHLDGVSNTQFLGEKFEASIVESTQEVNLWGQIDSLLRNRELKTYDSKDGELILFDSWSLHRAMPTKIRGWRLFFRVSMWHKPNLGDGGMLTKQEQVYKLTEGGGW